MIIDASVAVKWLISEDDSDIALAISTREDLFAPNLLLAEVANALCKKAKRGEIAPDVVPLQLASLPEILELVDESDHVGRGAAIALELGHSVYDCIYLALAEARGDNLITADKKFLTRAADGPFAFTVVNLAELRA